MDEEDEEFQVRTIAVPRWLSTLEVTKHLVGGGKKALLEENFPGCSVTLTGQGSGAKDPRAPGHDLPHLLVTTRGTDVRELGRLRRDLEDALVDYVLAHAHDEEDSANPPPALGRLLYGLGLSAASPEARDRTPDRTVRARSHFPVYLHTRRDHAARDGGDEVWMHARALPRDAATGEYHGRFLASRSLLDRYRARFRCRVDVYGVWGDAAQQARDQRLCAPYALVTGAEEADVDGCVQYVEDRVREHEEKFGVTRAGGPRALRGEKEQEEGGEAQGVDAEQEAGGKAKGEDASG